jgi:hypothetical protein
MRLPLFSRALLATALACALVPLTGCGRDPADTSNTPSARTAEAPSDSGKRDKVVSFNGGVTFDGDQVTLRRDTLPDAVITPGGDLLLGGKTVTHTDAQRQAMVAYRKSLQGMVQQSIEVGKAGAQLGAQAATEAIKGLFSGNTDQIEAKVEAKTDGIKAAAAKLCDHLETMRVTQDAAVALVPEFKPYGGLDQDDVTDCRK